MLKTHWKLISIFERFGDNILIILAFFISYSLRDIVFYNSNLPLAPIEQYYIILGLSLPIYNASLSLIGAYRSMRFSNLWKIFKVTIIPSILVFVASASLLFILKVELSRSLLGLFCLLCACFHFVERWLVLNCLRFFRVRGKNFRNLLIVGTSLSAKQIYQEISKLPELGVKVAGFVQIGDTKSEVYDLQARIIADKNNFESVLKKHSIDEVIFSEVDTSFKDFKNLTNICNEEGVQVSVSADLLGLDILQSNVSSFGTMPLIQFNSSRGVSDNPGLMLKRWLDLVLSLLALIVLSPIFLIIAVLIKLDSKGPALFSQKRVGKNGRVFYLYKFRSMIEGAEDLIDDLKNQNEMSGPVFKLSNDPRITNLGRFLRKYSLDELPQLYNVLVGEMSLVGPRPPLPKEIVSYQRKQRRRLSMRPGLTCTWQVLGRNNISDFDSWAEMDLDYVDNWTLGRDLKLLLKTIPVVISGSGAK